MENKIYKIKNMIKNITNQKETIWSHYAAIFGWILICTNIYGNIFWGDFMTNYLIFILPIIIFLTIPLCILILIETLIINNFKGNSYSPVKNSFYYIIWKLGLIGLLFYYTFSLYLFIKN